MCVCNMHKTHETCRHTVLLHNTWLKHRGWLRSTDACKGGKAWESLDPQRTMSGHYVKRAWHSLRHRPLRSVFCFVFYSKYLTAMRAVSVKLKRQAKSVKVKKKKMCVNFTVMLLCSLTTVTTVCLCSRFQCSHPLILQQHRYVCGQLWFRVN